MRGELTQAQLEHEFYGEQPQVAARFYDHEVLDVEESEKQHKRVNKSVTYVHLKCASEESEFKRRATPEDQRRHPFEWKQYLKEKEDGRPGQVQNSGVEEDCIGISPGYIQTA